MVHIRKVEIYGFKSFGFKNTTVDFQPGLVSISGPNGSGKSNILDAIMFASGENRPKTMRVDKLRSLIHDSPSRGGQKMTRVSVHFENSDRGIPVDSDAVEMTREMDTKGDNQYYVNKKKSSRGRVIDLLEMANAGLNQLNAVQQGTVTRISEFSAEEKRKSIEDLVGISSFDDRKAEAQKNLEQADTRLKVAFATMEEIKKQIDELEVQRNLQMRHDFIAKETGRLAAIEAAGQLRRIAASIASKDSEIASAQSELDTAASGLMMLGSQITEAESAKAAMMSELDEYNQKKAELDGRLAEALEGQESARTGIAYAQKGIERMAKSISQLRESGRSASASLEKISAELGPKRQELQAAAAARDELHQSIRDAASLQAAAMQRQSDAAKRAREVEAQVAGHAKELNSALLEVSRAKSAADDAQRRSESNAARIAGCKRSLEELGRLAGRIESVRAGHAASVSEMQGRLASLRSRKEKTASDIEHLEMMLEQSSKAGAKYDARIRTVKGIMHEDYSAARLRERASELGVLGLAYELVSWDAKYERAAMAAGSEWIKALVVRDFEALASLAAHARSKSLPLVKIIPLEAIPRVSLQKPPIAGITGVLSERIKCSRGNEALRTFLFGSVLLAESAAAARAASRQGYRAVTLDGQYFESKESAVVIDINSRISKVAKILSMSTSVEGLLSSISLLKKYSARKKSALKRIDASISAASERLKVSSAELARAQDSASGHTAQASKAQALLKSLESRNAELHAVISGLPAQAAGFEREAAQARARMAELEGAAGRGQSESISSEIIRANEMRAELDSRHAEALAKYGRISAEVASLESESARLQDAASRASSDAESLASETAQKESELTSLQAQEKEWASKLVGLRQGEQEMISSGGSTSKISQHDEQISQLRGEERQLAVRQSAIVRRHDGLSRDAADLRAEQARLKATLDAYGHVAEYEDGFEAGPLLYKLRAEQASLGALNAIAPAKYVEIAESYRSMSARKNSLEGERNKIVRFIEDIEKSKRQTFLDAFEIVDREVRGTFSKMTGGNAWLELQDEDDIFSSGISYMIQFAGKPKRESTSISGGEKTLAAIVFVLALQKLRPSPFYLFDEVDAHLDAPNAERLSSILEERAKASQFIMVSLKDSVVSKASLIYGVYPRRGDAASQVVRYSGKKPRPVPA